MALLTPVVVVGRDGTVRTRALRRLMHLVSQSLPIGSYAYSQGMESMHEAGRLTDDKTVGEWLNGLMGEVIARVDIPALVRLYAMVASDDPRGVRHWNDWLIATRETAELRQEEVDRGRAMAVLMEDLGWFAQLRPPPRPTVSACFAYAAVHGGVGLSDTAVGYLWSWLDNQILVATKLVPLGQTAGQRLLDRLSDRVEEVVEQGIALTDDEMGASAVGLSISSAMHETQYSRLFRS